MPATPTPVFPASLYLARQSTTIVLGEESGCEEEEDFVRWADHGASGGPTPLIAGLLSPEPETKPRHGADALAERPLEKRASAGELLWGWGGAG